MGSIQEQSSKDFRVELERNRKLSGWKRLGSSLQNALNGFAYVWQSEQNFRIEIVGAICAISLAMFLNINLVPIFLCCGLVLSLEIVNSAIEKIVDLISPDYHVLAKQAKDIAAGSVLVAAGVSIGVAVYLFLPAIFKLIL